MIINGLEDVRFTLNEGAWIDDKLLRDDSDAVRVKLRLARLRFAVKRPPYNIEGSPVWEALQNDGRFTDDIEETLFHADLRHRYNDGSGKDWSKEHPLTTGFTAAELVFLGTRAVEGFHIAKGLYRAGTESDVEVFRQELQEFSGLQDAPTTRAFLELAADTEAIQEINDGVTEISETRDMNNMVTAGFIVQTIKDYFRS